MRTTVEEAIDAVARGEIVIVTDDEARENEGDLIVAGEAVTPAILRFFLEHTSGLFCVALTAQRADDLDLAPMVVRNEEAHRTAFTVSVDLAHGISTGISATDRAATIRALADDSAGASDFVRPGHVFPLRARRGGVLRRAGHTEAAVDLARLAGRTEVGLLCEVVAPDKIGMASRSELEALAVEHGLAMTSVQALVRHRMRSERLVRARAMARVPTRHGAFTCQAWEALVDGTQHMALTLGDLRTGGPVLTRVHSECLTGDVFGSERCDCGSQLDDALAMIAAERRGVVVYLRGHEGRGIGLAHKLEAYNLQDAGFDTVDANVELGLPVDDREYGIGAQMLAGLGVHQVRLITNNPAKFAGLEGYGIEIIQRVPLPPRVTQENVAYLETKRRRMGHQIPAYGGEGFGFGDA
jgi:3,4-dihydroxy 2-butanone 4-phosphate synthase/GTP cyclohydrolase II